MCPCLLNYGGAINHHTLGYQERSGVLTTTIAILSGILREG